MQMNLTPVMQKSIDLPKPSYDQAVLPPDITALSSEQLAEMFTVLTGWADYMASQLVQAQLAERDAQVKLDRATNRLMIEKMGAATKADKVTLIKAQINSDPEVLALEDSYEEAYAYRKILEMMLNNQERDITLVSREISRRSQTVGRRDSFSI